MGSDFTRTLKIISLNVRGCGAVEKMEEIGRMFVNRKIDVLALKETYLREKGEIVLNRYHLRESQYSLDIHSKY